jgi:hypothetical protein
MPMAQLTNIAGADGLGFSSGPVIQDVYNSSTTVTIPFGTLVQLVTPITTTTTTVFAVKPATTTASQAPLNIGVAVGASQDAGPGSAIASPGTGQVVIHGHCRALFDATTSPTVAGHYAIIGGTTAGALTDSGGTTAAAGLDYGVVLEAITISSGTSLVNIWFEKT